jgi:hypothetical protein
MALHGAVEKALAVADIASNPTAVAKSVNDFFTLNSP